MLTQRGETFFRRARYIVTKLLTPPPKLKKKVTPRNVPERRLPRIMRSKETQNASFSERRNSATRVTTLASPILTPGKGTGGGRKLSTTWSTVPSPVRKPMYTRERTFWILQTSSPDTYTTKTTPPQGPHPKRWQSTPTCGNIVSRGLQERKH